jgi:hypothetical protein
LPDVVGAESWNVIKDIAAAEFALVGFDTSGSFFFRSRETSVDPTTVEEELTADRALIDLATESSTDSIRNVVTTETTKAYLRYPSVIVESRDVEEYESPVGVWTHDVPLEHGSIGWHAVTMPQIADASWNDDITWGFVPVQAASPGTVIASGVTVTFSMQADRRGLLTVRNYSQWAVRFATTSGSPALRILGWSLEEEPAELSEVRAEGSIDLYGERVLSLDASPWRQLTAPLQNVAGGLLSTLSNPLPALANVEAVGNPSREIGHTVRLVDPDGHGSMRANIVSLRRSFSDGKLTDSLGLRPVAPPGLGIWDDTELGIWDDTFVWGP